MEACGFGHRTGRSLYTVFGDFGSLTRCFSDSRTLSSAIRLFWRHMVCRCTVLDIDWLELGHVKRVAG